MSQRDVTTQAGYGSRASTSCCTAGSTVSTSLGAAGSGAPARVNRWERSCSSRRRVRATASRTWAEALIRRPCSSQVYQVTPTPESRATSSRRSPGVRRRYPGGSPTSSAVSRSLRVRRNDASSRRRSASRVRPSEGRIVSITGTGSAMHPVWRSPGPGARWWRYQDQGAPGNGLRTRPHLHHVGIRWTGWALRLPIRGITPSRADVEGSMRTQERIAEATPTSGRIAVGSGRAVPAWVVLALVCLGQFMVVLDISIVNVALPSIQSELHFSASGLQWVVNAYTLTFAGFLLLGGRAADLFGRRRMFLLGLGMFTVASLLGGLAQNQAMLLAARALQGLGGAVLAPATLTILTTSFAEGPERARALGVWSAVAAAGASAGALLGGILTDLISWRWILFVNVPIGVAAILAARAFLPESRAESAHRRLDVAGALTVTGGLVALVYRLVRTQTYAWTSRQTLVPLGV